MFKRQKTQSLVPDTRPFEIGNTCIKRGFPEEKFIIQGIDRRSIQGTVILTLGNLIAMGSDDQLSQIQVDSRDIDLDDSSLKLRIILPYQEESLEGPDENDIDEILTFFGRGRHRAFKEAFKKFCGIFQVEYDLARTLFITRLLSWDLQDMFDRNEDEWLISRTGRLYVSRFTGGIFETRSGSRTVTIKPSVVSSEVAMLKHQRKIINSATTLSSLQLDILKMTPPPVDEPPPKKHSLKKPLSKKKQQQRSRHLTTSTRPPEYEGFGMIDFATSITEPRRKVESYTPIKLRIIPLGGRVIGAHKTQVTALNLMNHAEQMLFKWRRNQDKEHPQPAVIPELNTLARASLFQVIPSTERFNHQHYTDQVIPAEDRQSKEAYERMVMCILANEYLTDIVDPLADLFSHEDEYLPLATVFANLTFSLMYSDLELRLQTPQDAETSTRHMFGAKMEGFIEEVTKMNGKRLLMSNRMKNPELFNSLYEECNARLPPGTPKHVIEDTIRQFFKGKLLEWGIREIDSIPEEKDAVLPSISGSLTHFLRSNPTHTLEDMLQYNLNPAQNEELRALTQAQPTDKRKPATYARRIIQEGNKFIHKDTGVFTVERVYGNNINIVFDTSGVKETLRHNITTDPNVIPYPKMNGSIYEGPDQVKFTVTQVHDTPPNITFRVKDLGNNLQTMDFHYLWLSRLIDDKSPGYMKRPTKKRRHKRRNTRKGG